MRKNLIIIVLLHLLVSCAQLPSDQEREYRLAYLPSAPQQDIIAQNLPVFLIEKPENPYNRIGTPRAELDDEGKERIYVDAVTASIYTETRRFSTTKGSYTNLIYRVHFSKTPWGLIPFQIGAGRNVGLFVIVTVNSSGLPVLYTTVHTCGCYLAFIPTTYLPGDALPSHWPDAKQIVYGKTLPAMLNMDETEPDRRTIAILLENASHRVKNVWPADNSMLADVPADTPKLLPIAELEILPLGDTNTTTSLYETGGPAAGYVKGSCKPLERLLMSWWALDWRIGEDKKLGRDTSELPIFFTSLKPWARDLSDMRDFPRFLSYWGWNL